MKIVLKNLLPLWMLMFFSSTLMAQQTVHIAIISDNNPVDESGETQFAEILKHEIEVLLQSRYDLSFNLIYTGYDLTKVVNAFETVYADDTTDIVLASGPMSSNVMAQWSSYAKPSIATLVLSNELQRIPITPEHTSGVENFTYVQSPFDIYRDMKTLHRMYPYKKLGVIGAEESVRYSPSLDELFQQTLSYVGADYQFIPAQSTAAATLENIPDDVDALYLLPLFDIYSRQEEQILIQGINERKTPSAGLLGEELVEPGILMGYEANDNFQRIPRRAALDVSKILEGQNAAGLPVLIPTYNENLLINMATAAKIGTYPSWDLMADATLLKIEAMNTDNKWTLRSAIMHALEHNLNLQIAQKDPLIAEKDVALAMAEYLPSLDFSTSLALIDKTTAFSRQGTQGQISWLAGGSVSQLIFSEPAMANIMIQKMLLKGQEAALDQVQLDVIQDVSEAYLTVLQAASGVQIQNENVIVTKRNLDIAKAKESVGYSGATDINRWESELALSNIELNNAQASLRQARFNLNQILNRPIDEEFILEDIALEGNEVLSMQDQAVGTFINNPGDLKVFANFLVSEAFQQLPEIRQLNHTIDAQNRQLLSQKRAFVLPSVAVSGGVDYLIDTWQYPEGVMPIDINTTWNMGVGLQFPIFQGGKRKINADRSRLSIMQLEDQKQNLLNQLELLIRANLETVGASYSRTILSREAADAARKNFEIIQDSYSQGLVNVTTLIDAQNATLQTELTAVNAIYQLTADFLNLERSVGSFYFLNAPAEQEAYKQRLISFLSQSK